MNRLLEVLTREFNKGCSDENLMDQINKISNELDDIAAEEAKSIIFRSKARWIKDGERNSKYFFSLEKKRYLSKNMSQLLTDNGNLVMDQKKILDEQVKFYRELYSSNPTS